MYLLPKPKKVHHSLKLLPLQQKLAAQGLQAVALPQQPLAIVAGVRLC